VSVVLAFYAWSLAGLVLGAGIRAWFRWLFRPPPTTVERLIQHLTVGWPTGMTFVPIYERPSFVITAPDREELP
jgi:hypothetical protein